MIDLSEEARALGWGLHCYCDCVCVVGVEYDYAGRCVDCRAQECPECACGGVADDLPW